MELRTRYDFKVTEADLEKGQVGDSYKCMAVRAIARAVPDASYIRVDTQAVTFTVPHEGELTRLTFLTPPLLQGYVITFDAGEELWPFRFALKDPYVATRMKRSKAAVKAITRGQSLKKQAIATGVSPEEAKEIASEGYRQSLDDSYVKAHQVHEELVQQGIDDPVEQAADAAGLLVATPNKQNRANRNADPLFAASEKRNEPGKTRQPTPSVFKGRMRVYGQRALRINWPKDPVTGERIKPALTRLV